MAVSLDSKSDMNDDQKNTLAIKTSGGCVINIGVQPRKNTNSKITPAKIIFIVLAIVLIALALAVVWKTAPLNFCGTTEDHPKLLDYSRLDWLASPAKDTTPLQHPVAYYIISHSSSQPCYNYSQCVHQIRKIQYYHMEKLGWSDIGYNFMIGGDGGVYEGRGWDNVGAHSRNFNTLSIGINLIGDFRQTLPTNKQVESLRSLFETGVRLGKVDPEYKLIGHGQVSKSDSPGLMFMEELKQWPHWYSFFNSSTSVKNDSLYNF